MSKKHRNEWDDRPTVDLSIDFDFWVRLVPEWDFKLKESKVDGDEKMLFSQFLWNVRYGMIDLYAETSILKYADFQPVTLMHHLSERGMKMYDAKRRVAVADSHRFAYDFFAQFEPPDYLVNIDAHHDCWPYVPPTKNIDCGNWIPALQKRWSEPKRGKTRFQTVYPKWKEMSDDGPCHAAIGQYQWADWPGLDGYRIRHIFLCRSPEWVPPHHDRQFVELMQFLAAASDSELLVMDTMYEREAPSITEARIMFSQMQEYHGQLQKVRDIKRSVALDVRGGVRL